MVVEYVATVLVDTEPVAVVLSGIVIAVESVTVFTVLEPRTGGVVLDTLNELVTVTSVEGK